MTQTNYDPVFLDWWAHKCSTTSAKQMSKKDLSYSAWLNGVRIGRVLGKKYLLENMHEQLSELGGVIEGGS